MRIKRGLSKKKRNVVIISIVAGLVIIGSGIFLLWRVNQEKSLSSDEDDASYSDCVDSLGYVKPGCLRCQCQDGAWVVGKGSSCWTLCGSMGHNKSSSSSGGSCIQGSQCPAV